MKFKESSTIGSFLETLKVLIRTVSRFNRLAPAVLAFSFRELFIVTAFSQIYRAGKASTYKGVINALTAASYSTLLLHRGILLLFHHIPQLFVNQVR